MPERLDFPKGEALSTRIAVFVPSTKKDRKIPSAEYQLRISEARKFLSNEFGGSTSISALGSWVDSRGNVVREDVTKVEVYADSQDYLGKDLEVRDFLNRKLKEWDQEEIAFEFETPKQPSSRLFLVKRKKLRKVM